MGYALLADLVVAVHVGYVSFVLLGELAIVVGALLRWSWVRNRWFRLLHLSAITIVAVEAIIGMTCPLTDLEYWLRAQAGQQAAEGTFIGRWLHELLFVEMPPWALMAAYIGFAALVLVTLWAVPPQWRRPERTKIAATAPA